MRKIVAIHQPNYLPWLGYFAKIAQADHFVFLDDVQFSKGSYTNRVQIAQGGAPVWLTIPIRQTFGLEIRNVEVSRSDWSRAHCDTLKQAYGKSTHFKAVWRDLEAGLLTAKGSLAEINVSLIKLIAERLRLNCIFQSSSSLRVTTDAADERLAAITHALAPHGAYLSGAGGVNYQSPVTFERLGLALEYSRFKPLAYSRSDQLFLPGLSVVDALFHIGFDATADLLRLQA
ncbi:MAG: WbqC family protein [Hyphomicrobium sp.]